MIKLHFKRLKSKRLQNIKEYNYVIQIQRKKIKKMKVIIKITHAKAAINIHTFLLKF